MFSEIHWSNSIRHSISKIETLTCMLPSFRPACWIGTFATSSSELSESMSAQLLIFVLLKVFKCLLECVWRVAPSKDLLVILLMNTKPNSKYYLSVSSINTAMREKMLCCLLSSVCRCCWPTRCMHRKDRQTKNYMLLSETFLRENIL